MDTHIYIYIDKVYIYIYICMKPAWSYLYEIKVSCGNNNPPSLVGGRVRGQTQSPGFCSYQGHALSYWQTQAEVTMPFTKAASQWPPRTLCWTHLRKEFPGCSGVQKALASSRGHMVCQLRHSSSGWPRCWPCHRQVNVLKGFPGRNKKFSSASHLLPFPGILLDFVTIKELLWL
jgi:hypothetical protein